MEHFLPDLYNMLVWHKIVLYLNICNLQKNSAQLDSNGSIAAIHDSAMEALSNAVSEIYTPKLNMAIPRPASDRIEINGQWSWAFRSPALKYITIHRSDRLFSRNAGMVVNKHGPGDLRDYHLVWRKLIRNPNTYSSLIGVIWSLVSYRSANQCQFLIVSIMFH